MRIELKFGLFYVFKIYQFVFHCQNLFLMAFSQRPPASVEMKQKFSNLNPQAPFAQKSADEVVFRRFQGEEVEFL